MARTLSRPTGRRPISRKRIRYPEQSQVRIALDIWALKQESLRRAAIELNCSYNELSNWRHGQRWIPDAIVEWFGFDPAVFRNAVSERQISAPRNTSHIVGAAIHFVQSFHDPRKVGMRLELRGELIQAVENYLEGQ